MIFRQLFDRETCTYTYLLADPQTRDAALIDPVKEQLERDIGLIEELELTLTLALDTHVHADHITSAGALRDRLGATTVVSAEAGAACADHRLLDGQTLELGALSIEARHTPGHTSGDLSYVVTDESGGIRVFTGDTLLIRGCGRTDFQQGSSTSLYQSVHSKIFSLADETPVYPGHDYQGRTMTTVGEEKRFNPRLGGGRSLEEFIAIMDALELAEPANMAAAVPANLECGQPLLQG